MNWWEEIQSYNECNNGQGFGNGDWLSSVKVQGLIIALKETCLILKSDMSL